MIRKYFNSALILLTMLALYTAPASGQIVSFVDDSGKRVFVNAETRTVGQRARTLQAGSSVPAGFMPRIPQTWTAAPALNTAAVLENRGKIEEMIREVSARYSVDPALIRAVIQTESNWDSTAVSRKGALGLMQLVPGTAQQMGVRNAFDPKQNLDGGVRYLQTLLQRYNGDLDKALAAYNAGPGAVDRAGGVPRFHETREYVQKITSSYFRSGSDRLPHAFEMRRPIYRSVEADGRIVFTNE
jgi:soluble lytic murein transglycosylase-like protein